MEGQVPQAFLMSVRRPAGSLARYVEPFLGKPRADDKCACGANCNNCQLGLTNQDRELCDSLGQPDPELLHDCALACAAAAA